MHSNWDPTTDDGKPPWSKRADPKKVKIAQIITTLFLFVVGIIIHIFIWDFFVTRGLASVGLVAYLLYLVLGIIYLVYLHQKRRKESSVYSWSIDVLGSSIRGPNRDRNLFLQIMSWLLWGQFMFPSVVVYAIGQGAGDLGF